LGRRESRSNEKPQIQAAFAVESGAPIFQMRRAAINPSPCSVGATSGAATQDYVGGNVRGVIGDPLEILGDQDAVHGLLRKLRFLFDQLEQVAVGAAVHTVDLVVHLADRIGKPCVAVEQRLQARCESFVRQTRPCGKIHRQLYVSEVRMSLVRRAMLIDWSPIRSRSPLILMTARMKRRSMAMGLLLGEQVIGHLVELALPCRWPARSA